MRTNEVLALKVSDVDLIRRRFIIIPENERNNAKTKRNRIIPINNHLWEYIEAMNLQNFSKDYFVFGSPAMPGRGFSFSCKKDKSDYYLPNPTRVKRDTATKFWRKIIKEGLGLECDMYALKHKGAHDKENAGMSEDAIQGLFGHSHKRMTRKYLPKVRHEKEILEKSPAF